MANLMFEMADQVDILNRRLEWMAAQALQFGTVTITGDGFPTTLVDFGRDAAMTIALSGGATWTASNIAATTCVPSDNIEDWAQLLLEKSGAVANDLVFGTGAWKAFRKDPIVKQAIWYPGQAAGNNVEIGTQVKRGAQFKGVWGDYNLWLYNDWYVDDNNVEQPMLPTNSVILSGADLMGTRAFGQIMDPAFNYGPMAYAPKSWTEEDPAQRLILMQSSPIVIPSRVNAALCATVY
jgi:hypothetical protein